MASRLVFFYDTFSQPCRSVLMFMQKNQIEYEGRALSLLKGEQRKSAELKTINPLCTLPAIKDLHVQLFESDAILRYLAGQYKVADHWYPAVLSKRARIDEYLAWHHINTRTPYTSFFRMVYIGPMVFKKVPDGSAIAEAKKQLDKTANFFENYFLKDTDYINSDDISIADILAVCEFTQLDQNMYDVCKGRPKIAAWIQNVKSKIGTTIFEKAHDFVYKIHSQVKL